MVRTQPHLPPCPKSQYNANLTMGLDIVTRKDKKDKQSNYFLQSLTVGSLVLNQRSLFRVMRPPTACVPGTQCLLSQQGSYKPLCAIWTSPGLGIFTRLEGDSGCVPHGFRVCTIWIQGVHHMDSGCALQGFQLCIQRRGQLCRAPTCPQLSFQDPLLLQCG